MSNSINAGIKFNQTVNITAIKAKSLFNDGKFQGTRAIKWGAGTTENGHTYEVVKPSNVQLYVEFTMNGVKKITPMTALLSDELARSLNINDTTDISGLTRSADIEGTIYLDGTVVSDRGENTFTVNHNDLGERNKNTDKNSVIFFIDKLTRNKGAEIAQEEYQRELGRLSAQADAKASQQGFSIPTSVVVVEPIVEEPKKNIKAEEPTSNIKAK